MTTRTIIRTVLAAAAVAGPGLQALAADTAGAGLDEIVVTAQRRAETLQNVPLSITALSNVALEQKAVTTFFDYAGQVPNLAFANTGDGVGTARTVSIRGIAGDGTTGFYIDETPVPDSVDPRVLDVARIEVLRGPQGTLYGARSMGGTVRLITEQPDFGGVSGQFHVNGSQTANSPDQNYGADASINLPINDRLALRVVGFSQYDGGYFKRRFLTNAADASKVCATCDPTQLGALPTTTVDNVGATYSAGGSATLTFKVNDALTIQPRIMYQRSDMNGLPLADNGSYPVPNPGGLVPASMTPNGYTQYRFFNLQENATDYWTLGSVLVKYEMASGTLTASTSYFDRTVDETEDQTDFLWQNLLAPFNGIPLGDATNPATPGYVAHPIASTIRELKQVHRFVEEVRYTSKWDGPLQLVTGAFYSDTRGRLPYSGYYPPALALGISQTGGFVVQGIPGLPIPVNPANPDEIFGQDYQTQQQEPSVYGELAYDVSPQLKTTVGLRAYQVKTTTGGYLEGIAFGGARITDPNQSTSENGINPKVAIDYKVDPDHMLYAQAARGFRPGGLVPSVPGNATNDALGCFAQLQALGYSSAAQTKSYQSDHLWNFEVGSKNTWLDRRLTLDGAAYYIKWDNIQQSINLPCGFQFRANSGAATVKGTEIELHARATEHLDFSAGLGYQHARISEASPLVPQLLVGARVYQVPDVTGNANVSYTVPMAADRKLVMTAGWSYTGDTVSATVDPVHPRVRPAYDMLDARIAYERGDQEFALVGKNLGNTEANLGDNRSLAAETAGRPRIVVNAPRTVGFEYRIRF